MIKCNNFEPKTDQLKILNGELSKINKFFGKNEFICIQILKLKSGYIVEVSLGHCNKIFCQNYFNKDFEKALTKCTKKFSTTVVKILAQNRNYNCDLDSSVENSRDYDLSL